MRKLLELIPKENGESPVYTIALVENPATERPLGSFKIGLSKIVKLSAEDNMYVYASVLVPEKIIPRVNQETGEEYDIVFSKKTIARMAREYLKAGDKVSKWNSEHNEFDKLDGISVTQSWIVDNPQSDKAKLNGLEVVEGEWCMEIEVSNKEIQKDIQSGVYKGISIEADMDSMQTRLKKQVNQLNHIQMNQNFKALESVVNFLKTGTTVKLSEETEKLEEVKAAVLEDGEYTLDNGQKIIIRDGMAEMVGEVETVVEEMAEEVKAEAVESTDNGVEQLAELVKEGFEKLNGQIAQGAENQKTMLSRIEQLEKTPAAESVRLKAEGGQPSPFRILQEKANKN